MKIKYYGYDCIFLPTGHIGKIMNELDSFKSLCWDPNKKESYYKEYPPQWGIYWYGGDQIRQKGMPNYWQDKDLIQIL
jgi:hypothetical protein